MKRTLRSPESFLTQVLPEILKRPTDREEPRYSPNALTSAFLAQYEERNRGALEDLELVT